MRSLHTLLALAFCVSASPLAQQPATSSRFRVALDQGARTLALLRDFDLPAACCADRSHLAPRAEVDVIVAPEDRAAFERLGLRYRLIEQGRPFREIRAERSRNLPQAPDSSYYTVDEIEAKLLDFERRYPAIAMRVDITAHTSSAPTHENRHLYALKISDNVRVDEDEPTALMAAQHHARELNSPHMVLGAAERILSGYPTDPTIRAAVDGYELWLVPCVNPDGVAYVWSTDNMWRKNRRDNGRDYGVDLNRNYPFQWGQCGSTSSRTSSSTYRGPSAGSEPETRTMMALARKERFDKYLDFHSSGREILITYNSCQSKAYVGKDVLAVEKYYRDLLRGPMNYGTRSPSASGEAQEWHWHENGSLSYLVEIGTSFQPAFSATVSEEARVWPGVKIWLGLRPSLFGRVRSLQGGAAIAATIDPAATLGTDQGERSRAGDAGLYHLWLPAGPIDVSFAASGHRDQRLVTTAPSQGSSRAEDLTMLPVFPEAKLVASPVHTMGAPTSITLQAGDPGRPYWIPFALSTAPGIAIGPRTVPIAPDALFFLSANASLGAAYNGHVGVLDANGTATAQLRFPVTPILRGLSFFFIGITFEKGYPSQLKTWSDPIRIRFQ